VAYEGIGLCAIAEGQVMRLMEIFTAEIPEELRPILLRRLSAGERVKCLRLFLQRHQLSEHYPDLVDLLGSIGGTRNRLAHGNLIYVEPDDADDLRITEPIGEGIGIIGTAGTEQLSAPELEEFSANARRVVGC
jgi:hypothetical protein